MPRRQARKFVVSGPEAFANILAGSNMDEIIKHSDECAKITPSKVAGIAKQTGVIIEEVLMKLFKVNPELYFGNVSILKDVVKKANASDGIVRVLCDTSGSMANLTYNYHVFHNKMASIFKELESQGITVLIYYFSDTRISQRRPKTVTEFCRGVSSEERGCTYLADAWNQITDGILLLITDGQFNDSISSFNKLENINELILASPSWTTIGTEVIQQLREKIGTMPLTYLSKFDSRELSSVVEQIKDGADVITIPFGFFRFGTVFFPEFFLKPSMLGTIMDYLIKNKSKYLLKLLKMFQEMILSIHRTMKVDFVGTLENLESRALLKTVSVMKIIADVQMDSGNDDEDIADMWNSFYNTLKVLMDFGSQEKSKMDSKISRIWDECFTSDESFQILSAGYPQTHTLIFPNKCPFEIIKGFRTTSHALSPLHTQCLYLLFSKARIVRGVIVGDNHFPVFNEDLLNTIRLLPCQKFRSGDDVSFTYHKTVGYRLMCWLVADMMGPGKDNYQSDLKTLMICSLSRIPKTIYMGITDVDISKPSADKNKSIGWLRCLLHISKIPEILPFKTNKICEILKLYRMISLYYMG